MKLLLVDSSVWIQVFSKKPDEQLVQHLLKAKKEKRIATCGMIHVEVLRGCRSKREYNEMSEEFQALHWLATEEQHWVVAAKIGYQLAQKGLHPPATDLLIATLAITYECQLLERDKHFSQIAQLFPLRLLR